MHVSEIKNMLKDNNEDSATRYKVNLILKSIIPERHQRHRSDDFDVNFTQM